MPLTIKTAEQIKEDILNNIPSDYEKTEGNPTYDIPSSIALELATLYQNTSDLFDAIDIDKLSSGDLTRFVKQRKGIYRKEATHAIGILEITGIGTIKKGDIFETATGLQFEATETLEIKSKGTIGIKCLSSGSIGNVGANSIVFIPVTITGIISVTNKTHTHDGFDQEDDESLRQRYYEALRIPATSGNIYHYMKWAKEIPGIGNAKIFPLWDGDNTVKILVIDAEMQPASIELVNAVQNHIDPKGEQEGETWALWGAGGGQAPIGAYCTVTTAERLNINVSCDVIEQEGFTIDQVAQNIRQSIKEYLKEVAFKQNYVSFARIGSIIFNTEGVKDYATLTLNGSTANIDIPEESVAVIGTIAIT